MFGARKGRKKTCKLYRCELVDALESTNRRGGTLGGEGRLARKGRPGKAGKTLSSHCRNQQFTQRYGVVSEGVIAESFTEILRGFSGNLQRCGLLCQKRVRKFCGNCGFFTEILRNFFYNDPFLNDPMSELKQKKKPKDEVSGTDIPRTSGGHSGRSPGSKLRAGPDHEPRRVRKNFGQKTSG